MSAVVVVGGGVAGCAAAAAAARAGARTVLIEAGRHLGGVAVRGEHRSLCGLAAIDAPAPELLEPELVDAWVPRLATGEPQRAGRVWLWPTSSERLQAGLAEGLAAAAVDIRFAAALDAVETEGGRVVAVRAAGRRFAADAVIDASGRAATLTALGSPRTAPTQWPAFRSELRLGIDPGPAARVRALAAARAALGSEAAIALTPLATGRWQLSLDVHPGCVPAEAAAAAARVAAALGAELVACARAVAERDEGRPAPRVTLGELFAGRERGLCWAAWPREEHGPEGVAWTWPPAPRYGVPEAAARPAGSPANLWCIGKAMAVDAAAAAALRVTGTCLAVGTATGRLAAG